jgi:hypothetical protein
MTDVYYDPYDYDIDADPFVALISSRFQETEPSR